MLSRSPHEVSDHGLQLEPASPSKKRPYLDEENEIMSKKRRIETSQPVEAMEVDSKQLSDVNPSIIPGINAIPLEILGNNIFGYFNFDYWLRQLIPVCRHWQQAAIRSNVDKQLWLSLQYWKAKLLGIYTILAKYRITTLSIRDTNSSIYNLSGIINASSALSTLVLNSANDDSIPNLNINTLRHERITTLAIRITNVRLLPLFPNVKQLTLLRGNLPTGVDLNNPEYISDKVRELEIVIDKLPKNVESLSWTTTMFPLLKTLYVNQTSSYAKKEEAEEDWKKLEEYGKTLGVQVNCRFPHQHYLIFDLQGTSYSHFFNSRGHTPIKELYSYRDMGVPQRFLEKHSYITAEYEESFSARSRQFVFPTLVYTWSWNSKMAHKASNNILNLLEKFGLVSNPQNSTPQNLCSALVKGEFDFNSVKEVLMQLPKEELDQLFSVDIKRIVQKAPSYEDLVDIFGEERLLRPAKEGEYNFASYAIENYPVWLALVQRGVEISFESDYIGLLFPVFMKGYQSIKDIIPKDFTTKFLFRFLLAMEVKQLQQFIEEVKIQLDEVCNEKGQSVLTYLIELGGDFEDILEGLQIDINKPDKNDNTPLISAILAQSISSVDTLLEHGADPNIAGNTVNPLCFCLSLSDREFASQAMFSLLLHGADVNKRDYDAKGRLTYPMNTAVRCGAPVELVQVLVSHGARLDLIDNAGNTLLHALFPNRGDINNDGVVLENILDLIRYLSKHIDINAQHKVGQTPLHRAVLNSDEEMEIKTMIECGADVNAYESMMHMTPLLMLLDPSSWCDDYTCQIILTLLAGGKVNIHHKNKANQSFVHYLLQFSPAQLATAFPSSKDGSESNDTSNDTSGTKYNIIDVCKQYATPENFAFIKSEIEEYFNNNSDKDLSRELSLFTVDLQLTTLLIETLGVDVNFTDSKQNSLLLMAQTSFYSNDQVVEYLLSKGATMTSAEVANVKLQESIEDPTKYRMTCQVMKERQAYLKLGASKGSGAIRPIMKKLKRDKLPPEYIDDLITKIPSADLTKLRENKK